MKNIYYYNKYLKYKKKYLLLKNHNYHSIHQLGGFLNIFKYNKKTCTDLLEDYHTSISTQITKMYTSTLIIKQEELLSLLSQYIYYDENIQSENETIVKLCNNHIKFKIFDKINELLQDIINIIINETEEIRISVKLSDVQLFKSRINELLKKDTNLDKNNFISSKNKINSILLDTIIKLYIIYIQLDNKNAKQDYSTNTNTNSKTKFILYNLNSDNKMNNILYNYYKCLEQKKCKFLTLINNDYVLLNFTSNDYNIIHEYKLHNQIRKLIPKDTLDDFEKESTDDFEKESTDNE